MAGARLAETDREAAGNMVKRYMWNLNEESGGCAWGAPEAMAEMLANHEGLCNEYGHLMVSFITPEGLYLDYPLLQRGVVWGIGRMSERGRPISPDPVPQLEPLLDSPDEVLRALSARAVSLLGAKGLAEKLMNAEAGDTPVVFMESYDIVSVAARELVEKAGRTLEAV